LALSLSVIVCAYNEERFLRSCLHSLLAQTRLPDEILVVNNASTDATRAVAASILGVRIVDEPRKGLVVAREAGRRVAGGDILAYLDADCRAPLSWLERLERRFARRAGPVAVTGPYRYYDWDLRGRVLLRAYDLTIAPATHALVHDVLGVGAVLYGGNFAVRRDALSRIGGFDTSIDFHGEDTNLGRRLLALGTVELRSECFLYITADQDPESILRAIREQGAVSIACHPHHRTTRRIEISTCYLWEQRRRVGDLVDLWEAANRDDLFSVTSLKHYPYVASSDFHKPKHLYSWKTLLKCQKDWRNVKRALQKNVDIALTLYRDNAVPG
jgi:cellulose synthase/poly-beta-1,6-N-acetylglucosamine synthase-like glycosyltransferase